MKRVLLTGATGFIGRHTLPLLIEGGYEVHATTHALPGSEQNAAHWHQVDLMNPAAVADLLGTIKPSHLLHFAWYAEPGKYWTSEQNFHWVQASMHLLEVFGKNGGERVVMAGTCAEYDWSDGRCIESQTPIRPTSIYGACKAALQHLLQAYGQQFAMSTAWGRIFHLYGPHEHRARLVPSVILPLLSGQTAPCSSGEQQRDFLHVRDVASAFVALLDSDVMGPVNIGSGQPVAVKGVAERIAAYLGRPELVSLGAMQSRPDEPPLLVADVSRLTNEVKWAPFYNLDAGLASTIAWWREQSSKVGV
ncbi:MAG: NAD-dependent epimerase/dehydratase family protein [Burkholderiales bacterium]